MPPRLMVASNSSAPPQARAPKKASTARDVPWYRLAVKAQPRPGSVSQSCMVFRRRSTIAATLKNTIVGSRTKPSSLKPIRFAAAKISEPKSRTSRAVPHRARLPVGKTVSSEVTCLVPATGRSLRGRRRGPHVGAGRELLQDLLELFVSSTPEPLHVPADIRGIPVLVEAPGDSL